MTVTGIVIKNIIRKLLAGQDYRSEVLSLINAEFLQYVVDYFHKNSHLWCYQGSFYANETNHSKISTDFYLLNSSSNETKWGYQTIISS